MIATPASEGRRRLNTFIPVSRSKALTRAILWGAAALIVGAFAWLIYARVDVRPSAVAGRLVSYSIALVGIPVALSAVIGALAALRWLLLAVWPWRLGIRADDRGLMLDLGPFGAWRYDAARMDVRYPFELSTDVADRIFEAFLPEEEQIAGLLPRITHPEAREPLNLVMLRFAGLSEADLTAALRSLIENWRASGVNRGGSVPAE